MSIHEKWGAKYDKFEWLKKSPESILPSRRFSPETIAAIEKYNGGRIYTVSGASIAKQRETAAFGILDHSKDSWVCNVSVPAGQFAVFTYPRSIFVPDSFDLPLDEQEKLLEADTKLLRDEMGVNGFKLIVPTAPLVSEIFLRHYLEQPNPIPLFGKRKTTSTLTYIGNSGTDYAKVGYFNPQTGLFVYKAESTSHSPDQGLLRVAMPA
jgi:hypothetical protein